MLTEFLGFLIGFAVGIIMGMLGGGSSLLLPTMLYLLHRDVSLATAYTTILAGVSAVFGAFPRWRTGQVDWPTVFALGIPVTIGMLLVRGWLFDVVPDQLFSIGSLNVTKKMLVLTMFASILLFSFAVMVGLIGKKLEPQTTMRQDNPGKYYLLLLVSGLLIGILPGFTGAGGGVLIVPLLVIFFGTPMKTVVGTSLTIIFVKSVVGFIFGDVFRLGEQIEWGFLLGFSVVMILGVSLGTIIAHRIDGRKLKTGFAWFMLALAIFILVKEIVLAG